jgi:hypothetical protein
MTTHSPTPVRGARRGSAIILTLILTLALGALAMSAMYLANGTKISGRIQDRAASLQFAADAALQLGKSYVNADPDAMPETGFREITFNGGVIRGADGTDVPGVTYKLWVGPTGATSGQFGAFGSLIAEARDNVGGRVVRRLELAQENFARYAYWSNLERSSGGGAIYFGGGDVVFGPLWTNDTMRIASKGASAWAAQFRDDAGTAGVVQNGGEADWWRGYQENMKPISLPAPSALNDLAGYATSGGMNFTPPNPSQGEQWTSMRIEFVNVDIDGDGRDNDPQDGFFRVYRLKAGGLPEWIRGDNTTRASGSTTIASAARLAGDPNFSPSWPRRFNCGRWITVPARFGGTTRRFFPSQTIFHPRIRDWLIERWDTYGGLSLTDATNHVVNTLRFSSNPSGLTSADSTNLVKAYLAQSNTDRQCFLGGASELREVRSWRSTASGARIDSLIDDVGGSARTFVVSDPQGEYLPYAGTIDPRVTAVRPAEAQYLFPLFRGINSGARGVIHVNGTVGVSGTLVGRVTLRTTGNAVILDDIRYGTNPATTGRCVDVLGLLSEMNVVFADNMMNNQMDIDPTFGEDWKIVDDSKDLTVHAVMMALDESIRAERHGDTWAPTTGNPCGTRLAQRGCLSVLGGLIQERRGIVATFSSSWSGMTGFVKQYSYDRCANLRPPPYFPTTGRYLENRYMEVDPVNFNITALFARLGPAS